MPSKYPTVVNKTNYRTNDLRRFFKAGLEAMGASINKTIIVHEIGGILCRHKTWASYPINSFDHDDVPVEGSRISMGISKDDPSIGAYGRSFAGTFHHEVLHTLGLMHKDMNSEAMWCRAPQPWAEGLTIRKKSEPKPILKTKNLQLEKAQKSLAKWQKKAKLAATKIKKYNRIVLRMEKLIENENSQKMVNTTMEPIST